MSTLSSPEHVPRDHDRPPQYEGMVVDRGVSVPMRDGVRLCIDVHRPDGPDVRPALPAAAICDEDIQGPDTATAIPPQPAWSPLWSEPMEAGDTRFLVSCGYVHVVCEPRGVGRSASGGSREHDSYDLIEWIAQQPWCDGSVDDVVPPDSVVQLPPTHPREVSALRFVGEPMLFAGPATVTLYAAIDQPDTNWIVSLEDIGPGPHVMTVREGECELDPTLPERELTRGWLQASNRALGPERSTEWKPFHELTRAPAGPVSPGEVVEHRIEVLATANILPPGHRICAEISSTDAPPAWPVPRTPSTCPTT